MARSPHLAASDSLPSYLSRLTKTPLLTAEQERSVTEKVRMGCPTARERLIESNMRLVVNIARSYRTRNIPLEDLIQEGLIGLIQAAERFDPDMGYRFSTYATHWIRQAIGRAIDSKSKAIRIPAHVAASLRKIERERLRLVTILGHEPSLEQLASTIGLSPGKLSSLIQASREMLSLDVTLDGRTNTLGTLLGDDGASDPERLVFSEERKQELHRILSELNDREQRVMQARYNLGEGDEQTLQEDLAEELQLSRERVRQIEIQALRKLRALAQRRKLRDMIG